MTDWDSNHADLKWTAPESDGGSPIEKYIIERKDNKTRDWSEEGSSIKLTFTDKGLRQGVEYQFRIIAVNKAGPSAPSEPSKPVVAKPRFGK